MNKTDLVFALRYRTGLPGSNCKSFLNALGPILANTLLQGEEITIPGLGKVKVEQRAARHGRNPRTNEVVAVPAKKVLVFRPTERLKEQIAIS